MTHPAQQSRPNPPSEATPRIHPTAVVAEDARIAADVEIGPFCVIGPNVTLAAGVKLHSHVVIAGDTEIGEATEVFPFASLGHAPQDKKFRGEHSVLRIGAGNVIREHVTMNPGTAGGNGATEIGDDGLFMVGAHIAHDCRVGDHVILANNATVAGHCRIEDHAILGGLCAVHQFVRIGAHAFIGGMSGVENDVIPFGMALGNRAGLAGLNIVGLKRHGFEREQIHRLRQAYRMLFSPEGTLKERIEDVETMFPDDANVQRVIRFISEASERALCVPRNG